ncbi:MAG: hypothetical protein ABSC55_06465 [Syntrophorhabdales bacterium]|jgi:hypothetical protein
MERLAECTVYEVIGNPGVGRAVHLHGRGLDEVKKPQGKAENEDQAEVESYTWQHF